MAAPVQKSGVMEASIASMMEWARTEYAQYSGEALTVRLVSSPGNLRQAAVPRYDAEGKEAGTLAYPFALFSMGSLEVDGTRVGFANTHGSRGVLTNRNQAEGYAEFETMRPVALGFGVNFRTTAFDDVINWAHALALSAPRVQLWVRSDEGFAVECSVDIDANLTIPPLESSEAGSYYAFDTVLRLNTRIGVVTRHRLIQRINVEVHDSTGNRRQVYDGDPRTLLDRAGFDVHDLFDPATSVGRYTHRGVT